MKRPLERYAEKRAFTRTPEPAPKLPTDRRGPLLFVIQKHAARRLHYDFRSRSKAEPVEHVNNALLLSQLIWFCLLWARSEGKN
jgi:hypothetical protein